MAECLDPMDRRSFSVLDGTQKPREDLGRLDLHIEHVAQSHASLTSWSQEQDQS